MEWLDDIKSVFISGFTRDIVCHFPDGDIYRNCSTGDSISAQPSNTEWIRFTVIPGATTNATIGEYNNRLKSQVVNISVSIFVPRNKTFNAASTIESEIDSVMLFDSINTNGGGCFSLEPNEPKQTDTIYGDSGDVWNQVNLTYSYYYRYI